MKKTLFWIVGIVMVMQLIRPDFSNPKVDETLAFKSDEHVMSVLKTSCYDCHSNETQYPWYHNVAPLSWIMSDNIKSGRQALNFSNWESMETQLKLKRLKRAKQLIDNNRMPKSEYLMMHKNAVLDKEKKETLQHLFNTQIEKLSRT